MRKILLLILILCITISCKETSKLRNDWNCNTKDYKNLEVVEDYKKNFSIGIPKKWKTNLYFDDNQSSIFAADTTQQLTESVLLDVTFINDELLLDNQFKKENFRNNISRNLIVIKEGMTDILNKPSYYYVVSGKMKKYIYNEMNLFINSSDKGYIHAIVKTFGDSLVSKRICKAITLLEKIELN